MSLTDLVQKIEQDGKIAAEAIILSAHERSKKTSQHHNKLKESLKTDFERETRDILEKNITKVTLGAQREIKHLMNQAKQDEIAQVFESVLTHLTQLDDVAYEKFFIKFFEQLSKNDVLTIRTPASRVLLTENILKKLGVSGTVVEDNSFKGGFIASTNTYEYTLTFEKLLNDKKSEFEIMIAELLFT